MSTAPKHRDGAQSLHRAAALLRALSTRTHTGWRLSDLAQECGLDHATVHRLLACLVEERLAARVPGSLRYTLGGLSHELGVAAAPHFAIERVAAPALARLARETQDIVFLNVRSGDDSVCVARHEGRTALKAFTVDVGTRRPLCLSAGGAAIVVNLPKAEQARIERQNLQAIVRTGQARQTAVRRMMRRSRRAAAGLNLEDIIPGIAAVGVAIRNARGEAVASLSLAAPSAELPQARRAAVLARLAEEARAIEALIGTLRR